MIELINKMRTKIHTMSLKWMSGRNIFRKSAGIDGILVTVGLCVIALLLCVVMKDALQEFIVGIVTTMSDEAQRILKVGTS
ncbi:MAG: hypothetical protein LBM60_06375 [Clostridium sp.]|jgi:hypothetical protein|nr:hypothetical protein [Clostridium sp.]